MQKLKSTELATSTKISPAALAGQYLRVFEASIAEMDQFDTFLEGLKYLIDKDPYLEGSMALALNESDQELMPDFESLAPSETIFPIAGYDGQQGHLKYQGRFDGKPFEADDLHLIGAISSMIASLTHQAQQYKNKAYLAKVLNYLFNQFPLPVVCLDATADPILLNDLALELLGPKESSKLKQNISALASIKESQAGLHLEINKRLIYAEGNSVQMDATSSVTAYVLYDLSDYKKQLTLELEREIFRAESRSHSVAIAVIESPGAPGESYRRLKAHPTSLDARIQPLDACTGACIFTDLPLRQIRKILRAIFPLDAGSTIRASLLSYTTDISSDNPAEDLIQSAQSQLQDLDRCLLPEILVFDPIHRLTESLQLLLSDQARLYQAVTCAEICNAIQLQRFNVAFIDLDQILPEALNAMKALSSESKDDFRFFYFTYRQPAMVLKEFQLSNQDTVIQKPFNTDTITTELAKHLETT